MRALPSLARLVSCFAALLLGLGILLAAAPARADRASERLTCTAVELPAHEVAFCLRSRALSRRERLVVVARALEHGRGASAVDAVKALARAAFDRDARVRKAIAAALIALDVIPADALPLPAQATLSRKLEKLLAQNSAEIRVLRAADCEVQGGDPSIPGAVLLSCRRFVRCGDSCREQWAELTASASGSGLALRSARLRDEDHGLCGDCDPATP